MLFYGFTLHENGVSIQSLHEVYSPFNSSNAGVADNTTLIKVGKKNINNPIRILNRIDFACLVRESVDPAITDFAISRLPNIIMIIGTANLAINSKYPTKRSAFKALDSEQILSPI